MKTAIVTLIRDGETSAMLMGTYQENVRGVMEILYTPHHIVFVLEDKNKVAYKAERIQEFETFYDED